MTVVVTIVVNIKIIIIITLLINITITVILEKNQVGESSKQGIQVVWSTSIYSVS